MKKLPVLIVLLVFGLSFIGASSAFGKAKKLSTTAEYYYLEEPDVIPTNSCYVEVLIKRNSMLKVIDGNCKNTPGPVGSISDLQIQLNSVAGPVPATISSPLWIYYKASPGQYCYIHPVTQQYQCIFW